MFAAKNFIFSGAKRLIPATYLVVAGGASGGRENFNSGTGGGGGAGGFRTGSLTFTVGTGFTVTIGAGGTVSGSAGTVGGAGNDSILSSVTSTGMS
jgi:hypothetical protein